jgi:hypothetical protein
MFHLALLQTLSAKQRFIFALMLQQRAKLLSSRVLQTVNENTVILFLLSLLFNLPALQNI